VSSCPRRDENQIVTDPDGFSHALQILAEVTDETETNPSLIETEFCVAMSLVRIHQDRVARPGLDQDTVLRESKESASDIFSQEGDAGQGILEIALVGVGGGPPIAVDGDRGKDSVFNLQGGRDLPDGFFLDAIEMGRYRLVPSIEFLEKREDPSPLVRVFLEEGGRPPRLGQMESVLHLGCQSVKEPDNPGIDAPAGIISRQPAIIGGQDGFFEVRFRDR